MISVGHLFTPSINCLSQLVLFSCYRISTTNCKLLWKFKSLLGESMWQSHDLKWGQSSLKYSISTCKSNYDFEGVKLCFPLKKVPLVHEIQLADPFPFFFEPASKTTHACCFLGNIIKLFRRFSEPFWISEHWKAWYIIFSDILNIQCY